MTAFTGVQGTTAAGNAYSNLYNGAADTADFVFNTSGSEKYSAISGYASGVYDNYAGIYERDGFGALAGTLLGEGLSGATFAAVGFSRPLSSLPKADLSPLHLRIEQDTLNSLVELSPSAIRTTQTTTRQQGANLRTITESMRANGFVPNVNEIIDVVRMPDGQLTSLDNTRIVDADLAGVNIKARVSNFDDLLPANKDFKSRFIGRRGEVPSTFGDAVSNRISNQKAAFRNVYPQGAPFISFGNRY